MRWWVISLLLCNFGFFREFRPSEPFAVEFLSGEWRNVTSEEVNRVIYPIGTYSYLAQIVIVFIITDILRYKLVIIASAVSGIIMYALQLWTTTLEALMVVQVFYGTFMASEVAYYTYIYTKVDKSKYQRVTGHTRSAILCGRFLSAILAQGLFSAHLLDLRELNYITFGGQCLSLVAAISLPSVSASIYFYSNRVSTNAPRVSSASATDSQMVNDSRYELTANGKSLPNPPMVKETLEHGECNDDLAPTVSFSYRRAFALLWLHFRSSYSKRTIIMWSFWWALGSCAMLQVDAFVQFIWQRIEGDQDNLYNGAAIAAVTMAGAIIAFTVGSVRDTFFDRIDVWLIAICSLFQCGLVIGLALTDNLIVAYVLYLLCGSLFHFLITVASSAVAKIIDNECFALVFGFNTLCALIFQTLFTIFFVSGDVFVLDIQEQFLVYAALLLCLSIGYFILVAVQTYLRCRQPRLKLQTS